MAIKRELIQFTIVNSTDCNYNLPLFQQNVYSVNATTKYSWDVTTANLSCGTGTIIVNSVTYNLTFTPTLAGLLSALNALGFGFFCSETIGGNTFVYVVDDTNVYGTLDLCSATTTTTSTTTTTTTPPPTTTTTTSTTTTTTTPPPTTTTTTSTTTTTTTPPPTTTTTTSTTTTTTTPPPTTTTTTSTTTTTTTPPPTTTTTTTTTSTTTTTTTPPPTTTTTTTTTTSTTTTTTTLFQNLFFDATAGIGGYSVTAINVNGVTPTLTSGTNVPFNTDGHGYNTTQTGTNETLNITVGSYILNGCITVTDSASNTFQQNITGNGNYAFAGLTINNTTAVNVVLADNVC